jgi:amino acid permease
VICAIVAIAFIVVGIIYIAVPAGSLPGFMGHATITSHGQQVPSTGHHPLRIAGSLIVGVVFAVAAWFALKYKGKSATPASSTTKEPVNK